MLETIDRKVEDHLVLRDQAEVAYEILHEADIHARKEAYSKSILHGIAYDLRLYGRR